MDHNEIVNFVTSISSYPMNRYSSHQAFAGAGAGSHDLLTAVDNDGKINRVVSSCKAVKLERSSPQLKSQTISSTTNTLGITYTQPHSSPSINSIVTTNSNNNNNINTSSLNYGVSSSSTSSSQSSLINSDCVDVQLEDSELWQTFHKNTNEMIVTKNGRRMFPVVRVSITGLDPCRMYVMMIELVQLDSNRWKYINGQWAVGGKVESRSKNTCYRHPESPHYGSHWMSAPISFSKAKLTNKPGFSEEQIVLNSLHKYQPRVHVVRLKNDDNRHAVDKIFTFEFVETQFIAVTAYQNDSVS